MMPKLAMGKETERRGHRARGRSLKFAERGGTWEGSHGDRPVSPLYDKLGRRRRKDNHEKKKGFEDKFVAEKFRAYTQEYTGVTGLSPVCEKVFLKKGGHRRSKNSRRKGQNKKSRQKQLKLKQGSQEKGKREAVDEALKGKTTLLFVQQRGGALKGRIWRNT